MPSDNEIQQKIEEYCQRVLSGAKPRVLSKNEMEERDNLKGLYDKGYRSAEALQGLRVYTLTYNPQSDRIEVVYH